MEKSYLKIPIDLASKYLSIAQPKKKLDIRDPSFPKQDAFVMDKSRYIVAQCSRRAGKTNGLAYRFFRTLQSHPNALCLYIALTRESAKNIIWPILHEINNKFNVGCVLTDSNLTMTHPNGSRLQLFGADMKNFIRRLKGVKTPGVAIDEAQDFGVHLAALVDDVLSPTLTDYEDSWLAITGTPGPIPLGYFYSISFERQGGYKVFEWTLFDNPYLPNARSFVNDLKSKRGWDENNPTLRREWYNEWVLDRESLLIKYFPDRSDYEILPQAKEWIYLLGVDIGFRDADALALLCWNLHSFDIYLFEEKRMLGKDVSDLSSSIKELCAKYDISKIIMDTGGLGKKVAEEITRRHHIPIQAADKTRKFENIALLNDWLRLGRFKAKKDSIFAQDSYRVQIDLEKTTPDKIKVKEGFHSDMIDAVLYAFKESPAYTYQKPVIPPSYGSKEWQEQEAKKIEEEAIEYFEKQENFSFTAIDS